MSFHRLRLRTVLVTPRQPTLSKHPYTRLLPKRPQPSRTVLRRKRQFQAILLLRPTTLLRVSKHNRHQHPSVLSLRLVYRQQSPKLRRQLNRVNTRENFLLLRNSRNWRTVNLPLWLQHTPSRQQSLRSRPNQPQRNPEQGNQNLQTGPRAMSQLALQNRRGSARENLSRTVRLQRSPSRESGTPRVQMERNLQPRSEGRGQPRPRMPRTRSWICNSSRCLT
jgi:hypothetical protein